MSYEIFERLRSEKGVKVSEATGIPKGTFSHWKKGDYEPKADKRKIVADFFGVSLNYLDTGIVDNTIPIDDEDRNYLQILKDEPKLKILLAISKEHDDDDFNAVKDYAERLRRTYKDSSSSDL